eukprot:gene33501-2405_t
MLWPRRLRALLGSSPRVTWASWEWEPSGVECGWDAGWMLRQRVSDDFIATMRGRWADGSSYAVRWSREAALRSPPREQGGQAHP